MTAREPRPLGDSLNRIAQSLGGPSATGLTAIFEQWETIVGPSVAAHSWPISLSRDTLTVGVDQPGWATQLAYLQSDLIRRIAEVAGPGTVARVRVSVRPK